MKTKKKFFSQISITILLFLISTNEIKTFRCGADELKIKPKELIFNKTYSQKISNEVKDTGYTPIKIGMDYTGFSKPSSMSDITFNEIKNIISNTLIEFQKFLQVQHINIDINGKEDYIKQSCELEQISSDYRYFLINYDVIVFPSFYDQFSSSSILAAANICLTHKTGSNPIRPVGGILYINPNLSFNKKNTDVYMKNLLLHEITHILVFYPDLLRQLGMITQANSIYYITSTNVVLRARQHFNCASIIGVPLEDQGSQGSAGSHWEARHMLGDYMISTDYLDGVISDISIALFEDTGYYKVNYYSGGLFKFGKNKGCEFLNQKCINNGAISDEFCVNPMQPMCSPSRTVKGICGIYRYNSQIPSKYQYFSESNVGGFVPANYCPVASELTNDESYYYPTSCSKGTSSLSSDYGEVISDNSFCFISSLLPSSSSLTQDTTQSICYRVECNSSNKQIIVHVGSSTITCPTEGGTLSNLSGFKGSIICPKYIEICDFENNVVCNEMFDCLSKKVETDSDSYNYDESNEDFNTIKKNTYSSSYKKLNFNLMLLLYYLFFLN